MTIWLASTCLVSIVLAFAAFVGDFIAAHYGLPRRFIWIAAVFAATVVPMVTGLRSPRAERAPSRPPAVAAQRTTVPTAADWHGERARNAVADQQREPASLLPPDRIVAAAGLADRAMLTIWFAMSLLMLLRLGAGVLRVRRARRGWRLVPGPIGPALAAEDVGPAVTGVFHPRIVIPCWLADADESTRSLLLRHEVEHVRAGDTRVLFGSAVLEAVFPWNAPVRWMLRRLRLAIEIDCDRRVIEAIGGAKRYGRALLDASERFAAPLPMAASLHESPLQLEARIDAMTWRGRRQPLRGSVLVGAVAATVVALCGFMPWPSLALQRQSSVHGGRMEQQLVPQALESRSNVRGVAGPSMSIRESATRQATTVLRSAEPGMQKARRSEERAPVAPTVVGDDVSVRVMLELIDAFNDPDTARLQAYLERHLQSMARRVVRTNSDSTRGDANPSQRGGLAALFDNPILRARLESGGWRVHSVTGVSDARAEFVVTEIATGQDVVGFIILDPRDPTMIRRYSLERVLPTASPRDLQALGPPRSRLRPNP